MTATFRVGQVVPFPPSPGGVAQVGDLLRSRLELLYLRDGRVCRRRVRAEVVASWIMRVPLLLPADNLLCRGIVPRQKTYEMAGQQ